MNPGHSWIPRDSDRLRMMDRPCVSTQCSFRLADKGTPAARPVRKATGLSEMAWLPHRVTPDECRQTLKPSEEIFMRFNRLIPIAALAFAVACSEDATTPTSLGGPLFDVEPNSYPGTLDADNTPSGGHVQTGSIGCVVHEDLSITCSSYELAGVGHIDADVSLDAVYSADVLCNNPAGSKNTNNDIEPHATTFAASDDFTATSAKNGRLRVREASVSPETGDDGDLCPNGNWTAEFTNLQLVSFTYSVHFDGFAADDFAVFIHEE
jgi:hypothetical protein